MRCSVDGLPVSFDWESRVRKTPRPKEVARLSESHGSSLSSSAGLGYTLVLSETSRKRGERPLRKRPSVSNRP